MRREVSQNEALRAHSDSSRARLRERLPGSARRPGPCSGARPSAPLNLRSALLDTLADASLAPAAAVPPATVSACLFLAWLRVLLFVASAPGLRRGSTGEMAGADPTVWPPRCGAHL